MSRLLQVSELPLKINPNTCLEITSTNVNYFTHGFFKYPCKFIPHIPAWAIERYTKPNDLVLDSFAGSGTTLVESVLKNRNGLGIDFDPFSQLLCKAKTCNYTDSILKKIKEFRNHLDISTKPKENFLPDIHNIEHWFPKENIRDLSALRSTISEYEKDQKVYNFLRVCFASIIRKCSYAEPTSPKPYVSTRIKKEPLEVEKTFLKTVETSLKRIESFNYTDFGNSTIISNDARRINAKKYLGKVTLAITSPPYINAFDYVRSLRLENAWLGFYGDSSIIDIKRKQVGTETVSVKDYSKISPTGIPKLDKIVSKISRTDQKRAFVVQKFFLDMSENLTQVKKLLKKNSHYVIVVGVSNIRGTRVPTNELLAEIAKMHGYSLENMFSYIIKNRYLRIPRSGRGGLIEKDWILDLALN